MMLQVNKCPLCTKDLEWKQINMEKAIEICIDLKCPYPVNTKCRVMSRKIEDMDTTQEAEIPAQMKELDNILIPEILPPSNDEFTKELDDFLMGVLDNPEPVKQEDCNDNEILNSNLDALFNELDFNFLQ
ncbi:hypothetical protein HHI36_021194 [Cryptolaemus montrouzieri]|uniref:Uncharacterized protein n=1 Tax=Cryptolaemus montrouzieri TaxID=559131 RepID=A0ABD2MW69_9CUCU